MKAILFLAGGVLAVLLFLFVVRKYIATPENILFYEVSSEKNLSTAPRSITTKLRDKGIPARIIDKNSDYVKILTCKTEDLSDVLIKAPFFALLLPCEILLYNDEGKTKAIMVKEPLFIRYYNETLDEKEIRKLIEAFHRVRIALGEALR